MRHYGLEPWLETVSVTTGIDVETLLERHVDPVDAINALRAAGGPVGKDVTRDVAAGCFRLLVHMRDLKPYRGGRNDVVAHACIVAYARARGFTLHLGPRHMHFITEVFADALSAQDAIRAIFNGLSPAADVQRDRFSLEGVRVTIAGPVSNPTKSLTTAIQRIHTGLAQWLRRHGAIVVEPEPAHRNTASGRRSYLRYLPQAGISTASTSRILTRSIERITSAHVVYIIMDPRSQGSSVEREWALRCTIPVFEFDFSKAVHPHSDAPNGVINIQVDPKNPGPALTECFDQTMQRLWEIQDSVACAAAHEIKNRDALSELKTAWASHSRGTQESYSRTLGMTPAYIAGLLSGPMALELASDRQRHGLERFLNVPNTRALATPGTMDLSEMRLLAEAATRAGIGEPVELVEVVQVAGTQWRRSRSSARLRTPEQADESIKIAILRITARTTEADW